MNLTDVAWSLDHQGKPVLELRLDGRPAYIRSRQRTEHTERGIVHGIVFLESERVAQLPNAFLPDGSESARAESRLVGCTDDLRVFRLYQEMCDAIRIGTWRVGQPADARRLAHDPPQPRTGEA